MNIPVKQGITCKMCKGVYMNPCHGENVLCANRIYIACGRKYDPYDLTQEQMKKIKKTGKLPKPSEVIKRKSTVEIKTKEVKKKKRKRAKLDETVTIVKRKRVRL